jgi:hypothetical protein
VASDSFVEPEAPEDPERRRQPLLAMTSLLCSGAYWPRARRHLLAHRRTYPSRSRKAGSRSNRRYNACYTTCVVESQGSPTPSLSGSEVMDSLCRVEMPYHPSRCGRSVEVQCRDGTTPRGGCLLRPRLGAEAVPQPFFTAWRTALTAAGTASP